MEIIDIHSHILPGVDDGAESIEKTMEMLRIAADEGIAGIFATPHYRSGHFFTDAEKLEAFLYEIRGLIEREGIPICLYPGTEIFYRSDLEERLDNGSLATMNHSDRVLIEFSPVENFRYIRNALEDVRGMGYIPILAHVERYQCLLGKTDKVRELKSMSCEIQCNADSVTGKHGFTVRRFVHKLLRQKLIDYIGTDAHNTERRSPRIRKCRELLYKKYTAEYAAAILGENAKRNLLIVQEDVRDKCKGQKIEMT